MNLTKNPSNGELFVHEAESKVQSERNWALWSLGLLGNRGVDSERVIEVLIAHLKDTDEASRHWAVERLGLVGTDQTITPLLQTSHADPSPFVRDRAACSPANY